MVDIRFITCLIATLLSLSSTGSEDISHDRWKGKYRDVVEQGFEGARFNASTSIHHRHIPLLLSNRKDIRLITTENGIATNSTIIINHLEEAAGLDFHHEYSTIFWTDVGLEMIKGLRFNGTTKTEFNIITTGLMSPDDVACDWLAHKLYWTDAETNRIEVANLDGSSRKVLLWQDLDQPRALALVPQDGLMFWTDWGEVPKVERCSMNGDPQTRKVIVSQKIFWPNGITVDYEAKRIYWADAKLKFISSTDFDGGDRRQIPNNNMPHLFAVTIAGDYLYWTDWQQRSIQSCNKNTGAKRRTVLSNLVSPMDIQVFSPSRQPSGSTPCATNNGGCSHLCLLHSLDPYYSCACPTGVKLLQNGKTCAKSPEKLLLLARRLDIRRISLDTPDHTDVVIPLKGLKHVIAIDYDPIDERIYWTDDETQGIRSAFLNGTDQMDIVLTEVTHPDGIAVDWVARNLYWTDTGTDRIQVARLDGRFRKILINDGLGEPRAIVVHPTYGYMYWTDWGEEPKIERAALDGTQRQVLVNTGVGWPNGLAIDYAQERIYFSDAKTDKIEVMDLNGDKRRELVNDQLPHAFGLTVLDDYVYWTDWQRRTVERVHKETSEGREAIIEHLPDLMGIKAVDLRDANYLHINEFQNPCAKDNGGCNQLCLNRPNRNYICGCAMGFELSKDLRTCIIPDAFLLVARNTDIRRVSLESHHVDLVPISGVHEASSLDYDASDQRVYWTDLKQKMISRAYLNGSDSLHIVEYGLEQPVGISLDWITKNIYWADMGLNRIEVARLDGSFRKALIWENVVSPHDMTIDPKNGFIFWADWDPTGSKIERALLNGQQRQVIVSGGIGSPNGLTVDYVNQRLYWIDVDNKAIESSAIDGTQRRSILQYGLVKPYTATVYGSKLFFTDSERDSLEHIDKTTGRDRVEIEKKLDKVKDIVVYHRSRNAERDHNVCSFNNGGCAHLCLPATPHPHLNTYETLTHHSSRTNPCHCATHYTLDVDGRGCIPPQRFMLFSQKNTISRIVEAAKDSHSSSIQDVPDSILPIHNLKNVRSIAYDPIEQYVYWIDGRTLSIRRALDNGTRGYTVVPNPQDIHAPYDLVIDPYSRLIYWSCAVSNKINVTRLPDGRERPQHSARAVGPILGSSTDKPRGLALSLNRGYLFWINADSPARIERSSLQNGLDRETIINSGLEEPIALAADPIDSHLCWIDNGMKRIECSDFNGASRRSLLHFGFSMPISLTLFGPYLYWIDKEQKTLERVDKFTGETRQLIYAGLTHLSDIISIEKLSAAATLSICRDKNGGCSHICLAVGPDFLQRKCSCPQGLILASDERTCVNPPTCSPDQFACHSGKVPCIPLVWRCDGAPECEDRSDELECPKCPEDQYRCPRTHICIEMSNLCDGSNDCPDASDEQCCQTDRFRCPRSKGCLALEKLCDGRNDCGDGSDELVETCQEKKGEISSPHEGIVPPKDAALDKTPESSPKYTMVIVFSAIMLGIIVLVAYHCRKKATLYEETDPDAPAVNEILMATTRMNADLNIRRLAAAGSSNVIVNGSSTNGSIGNHNRGSSLSRRQPNSIANGSVSGVPSGAANMGNCDALYDRNITGASSSSSSAGVNYPPGTLNPPPTPVPSDQSQCNSAYDGASSCASSYAFPPRASRFGGPKPPSSYGSSIASMNKRSKYIKDPRPGPPPTPCTSVYEDSEVGFAITSQSVSHPGVQNVYTNSQAEISSTYDSDEADPTPPPPTPRNYFSDDGDHGLSPCAPAIPPPPPSPSTATERSFASNPQPPPPSPVQQLSSSITTSSSGSNHHHRDHHPRDHHYHRERERPNRPRRRGHSNSDDHFDAVPSSSLYRDMI